MDFIFLLLSNTSLSEWDSQRTTRETGNRCEVSGGGGCEEQERLGIPGLGKQ